MRATAHFLAYNCIIMHLLSPAKYMGIRINIAVNLSLNRSQCGATAVEKYSSGLLWRANEQK